MDMLFLAELIIGGLLLLGWWANTRKMPDAPLPGPVHDHQPATRWNVIQEAAPVQSATVWNIAVPAPAPQDWDRSCDSCGAPYRLGEWTCEYCGKARGHSTKPAPALVVKTVPRPSPSDPRGHRPDPIRK